MINILHLSLKNELSSQSSSSSRVSLRAKLGLIAFTLSQEATSKPLAGCLKQRNQSEIKVVTTLLSNFSYTILIINLSNEVLKGERERERQICATSLQVQNLYWNT